MVLDMKTFPKREVGQSCTICKTPDDEWAWVKTNHLAPQEEAWHWLTKQMVQNFGRFGKSGKKVIPRKELLSLNSPRNYRVFHTNGKRSLYLIKHRILIKGGFYIRYNVTARDV